MIKGGYQIIDLKGIELDDTPVTFDGIYDKMLENVGKVCLIANVDVNDPNFDHFFVQPVMSGTTILCTVGDKTLKVNNEDGVSIEAGIVGGGSGGTSDYTDLSNKPSINGVTLSGNKSAHDLGLQGELTAGTGINIENDVISASGDGPKITLSGTINSSSTYSGFNDSKQKNGSVASTNHNVVMNCAVDLKPLITTSSYGDQMLTVPVEGAIYSGNYTYNSCYLNGVAYIYETTTKYYISIRCTASRGSNMIQNIYSDYSVNKNSMSDPTKLILDNVKLPALNFFTAASNLGLGIEDFTLDIAISEGSGQGVVPGFDPSYLYTILTNNNTKLFISGVNIDGQMLYGPVSASGYGSYNYDQTLETNIYHLVIYFLGYVVTIDWNDQDQEYQYEATAY